MIFYVLFLGIKKEPKMALLVDFIEVGVELIWGILWDIDKRKRVSDLILLFFID